ncbi:MAG TPA: TetR/AcrR family transcriptional regulator [Micromonosporaceae bacterium]
MSTDLQSGRINQKRRTRQALVDAASQILAGGSTPTLDQVAEIALVSRATAYRYFSSADDLIADALLATSLKPASEVLARVSGDPTKRLLAVEAAVNGPLLDDERAMHMVARGLADQWLNSDDEQPRPIRRIPLIDAALEDLDEPLTAANKRRLRSAAALAIGMEAVIGLRDACGLSPQEARRTAQWAVRALVAYARSNKNG